MAVLKVILVILLCIPLVYIVVKMFNSLADDLHEQQQYAKKTKRKKNMGGQTDRSTDYKRKE